MRRLLVIKPHATLLLLGILASQAAAQSRIWVVDVNKGTGYDFTTITAAIAAAKHGDRIYVRSGLYKGFVSEKGLSITGGAKVTVDGIEIRNLPAGHTAAVRNLVSNLECKVTHCAGAVHIQNVWLNTSVSGRFRFHASSAVHLNDCHAGQLLANRTTVTLHACHLAPLRAFDAVSLTDSNLTAANCSLRAGASTLFSDHAIWMEGNCAVRLTSDGRGILATQNIGTYPIPAIFAAPRGRQTLYLDPRVKIRTYNNAPKYSGANLTVHATDIPCLSTIGAKIGKPLTVSLSAKPNHRFYLAVGVPAAPTHFPSHLGSVWLDLRTAILVRTGILGNTGTATFQTQVPNTTDLFGLTFLWQGLAGPNAKQLTLSNPASHSLDL